MTSTIPTPSTRNVTRVFRTATADDVAEGRAWYRRASILAAELAGSLPVDHQHHGDVDRAAAVVAVVSPLISWPLNVRYARALYRAAAVPGATVATVAPAFRGLKGNGVKAARLLVTDVPTADIVSGPKVTPFYRTIVDPADASAVVVDRHAVDIACGRVTDDRTRSLILGRKGSAAACRSAYARAARILTRELGELITPAEVQAVTWVAWRRTRAAANHGTWPRDHEPGPSRAPSDRDPRRPRAGPPYVRTAHRRRRRARAPPHPAARAMRNYLHTSARPAGVDRSGGRAIVQRTDADGRPVGPLIAWPRALPAVQSPCRHNQRAGVHQHRCSATHAALVESYRGWRDDAYAAAEKAASGYAAEEREYWTTHERPTFRAFLTYWHGGS